MSPSFPHGTAESGGAGCARPPPRRRRHRRLTRHRPPDRGPAGRRRVRRRGRLRGQPDEAEAAVKEAVTAAGGRAIAVRGDVADENDMSALFDRPSPRTAVSTWSSTRPGGCPHWLPSPTWTWPSWTRCTAPTSAARSSSPSRPPAGCARAARSSPSPRPSSASRFPGYGAYAASKGAVEALTLILARELRGRDVTVNAVAPGPTATDLFLDGKDEETIARLAAQPRWSASAPRPTSPSRRVPRLPGRPLDQRTGRPRQRRHHLTAPPTPSPRSRRSRSSPAPPSSTSRSTANAPARPPSYWSRRSPTAGGESAARY
jgi:NAD(P)-dependent dehydrogenase (short-subunit alcohol dehydrogenase family)